MKNWRYLNMWISCKMYGSREYNKEFIDWSDWIGNVTNTKWWILSKPHWISLHIMHMVYRVKAEPKVIKIDFLCLLDLYCAEYVILFDLKCILNVFMSMLRYSSRFPIGIVYIGDEFFKWISDNKFSFLYHSNW